VGDVDGTSRSWHRKANFGINCVGPLSSAVTVLCSGKINIAPLSIFVIMTGVLVE
jgi:hypothetical protein